MAREMQLYSGMSSQTTRTAFFLAATLTPALRRVMASLHSDIWLRNALVPTRTVRRLERMGLVGVDRTPDNGKLYVYSDEMTDLGSRVAALLS